MQRKYYQYDGASPAAAKFNMPAHAQSYSQRHQSPGGEIITPQKLEQKEPQKKPDSHKREPSLFGLDSFFQDGKLLGRIETDDIILLGIILLLLQNSEEVDFPLLLALGYIFLSDKDFKLF